ncbi:hypothetical protein HHL16_08740 [Pseudoflavitalea sp. G-6-1-2]|uniref:hypothetical protein n=1 Tax=Pseudoflavitalea sp. G-6-1-2 TaxID=2728841 RepID=UPI00146C780E|nr:hypothetical protein [Pseudoflavitalea sp. G-6-1-2]NML20958.1 hypothetical protein [Pseudoflavitalea sp. G-6-1-2]
MLTAKEKRFIKYWEEQRKGGQRSYLTLYILAGTFIATIIVFFIFAMFGIDFENKLWTIPTIAFVSITIISATTWKSNEKKFKQLIRREIGEGMNDENHTNGQ